MKELVSLVLKRSVGRSRGHFGRIVGMNGITLRITIIVSVSNVVIIGNLRGFRMNRVKTAPKTVRHGGARPHRQRVVRVAMNVNR